MKTHRSLRYVIRRISGSAGAARRESPEGTARAHTARGILVPALALASLGAALTASPGHIGSHVQASTHRTAGSHALMARDVSVRSCLIGQSPATHSAPPSTAWMYVASPNTAWMYVAPRKTAWMYVTPRKTAWMYVAPRKTAWMYAVRPRQLARLRACLGTSRLG